MRHIIHFIDISVLICDIELGTINNVICSRVSCYFGVAAPSIPEVWAGSCSDSRQAGRFQAFRTRRTLTVDVRSSTMHIYMHLH